MKPRYATTVDKEGLLSVLGGLIPHVSPVFDLRELSLLSGPHRKEITLVWEDEPKAGAPGLVIIDERFQREFFAFVSTYVSTYAPFSAFVRVVTRPEFDAVMNFSQYESAAERSVPRELCAIIIGEAFVQSGLSNATVDQVTVQACHATLSMAIYRALVLGFGADDVRLICDNWRRCRGLLNDEALSLSAQEIEEFWLLVSDVIRPSIHEQPGIRRRSHLRNVIESALYDPTGDFSVWRHLTEDLPDVHNALDKLRGSREERVRFLDSSITLVRGSKKLDQQSRSAIVGFILSRVSNGSLSHLQLSANIAPDLPSTPLWYALFSALQKDTTDALTIGGALGRRIVRDVYGNKDIFAAPSADISWGELTVLVSDTPRALTFRSNFASTLDVEIYPTVSARFKVRRAGNDVARPVLSKQNLEEMKALLYRLNDIVATAEREGRSKGNSPPDDSPLFDPKRRTRR